MSLEEFACNSVYVIVIKSKVLFELKNWLKLIDIFPVNALHDQGYESTHRFEVHQREISV